MNKVTAIMSVYNADQYLVHKIKNIKQSTIDIDIAILEVCNKSTIDLTKYATYYEYSPNLITIYEAWNRLIKASTTPYIVTTNCDDLVHPKAYELQSQKLEDGFDISYFNYYVTNGYTKTWEEAKQTTNFYNTPPNGYVIGCGLGPFAMWKKSLHEKYGYFDEKLKVFGDSWFWTILEKSKQIKWGHIDQILGSCARTGNNLEIREGDLDEPRLEELRKTL